MNQAAPDIRKLLQRLDRLGERGIRELIMVADRVYNTRESAEEKETKREKRQGKSLARILEAQQEKYHQQLIDILTNAGTTSHPQELGHMISDREWPKDKEQKAPRLRKNQCTYCKEEGHWAREFPKKKQIAKVLKLDIDRE